MVTGEEKVWMLAEFGQKIGQDVDIIIIRLLLVGKFLGLLLPCPQIFWCLLLCPGLV